MKIIAVMNQKGGIGKTMTAAAIAYIMGEEKGKKVLICDADQQGNVSLLYDRFDPEGQGMSELLENHQAAGGEYSTTDLIQTTPYGKKLNGKYEFVWLYVGTFGQGYDDNYQTQEDKVTTQTATLKGSFYERACDGNFETQVDESNLLTEHTDAAAAIKNWFGKVQEPTEAA